jgi:hypothetical protein
VLDDALLIAVASEQGATLVHAVPVPVGEA